MKRGLFFLLVPFIAQGAIPVRSELSVTSSLRTSDGAWETNRFQAALSAEPTVGPVQLTAKVWAWYNASFNNYGLNRYDISIRALKAAYWGENFGITAGVQEIHWGETFGFQPLDLVSARNFRDFPLLDHERNRIPIPGLYGFYSFGDTKLEVVMNPRGEMPILPQRVAGLPVSAPNRDAQWLIHPEFGLRLSTLLERTSLSTFYYRHLNRIPVLVPSGGALQALFEPVSSVGASASHSTDEWVFRGDALATLDHPVALAARRTVLSTTAGADWSPAEAALTLGAQLHWDRFPLATKSDTFGISALARKSFWNEKVSCEAQLYRGLRFSDLWVRLQGQVGLGEGWTVAVLGEVFDLAQDSPFALFAQGNRVATTVSYVF